MLLRYNIAVVLLVVCLATPAWSDYKAGEDAYHRGDYPTAVREWSPLAKLGLAAAQFHLGQLYANGEGVPQDYVQARQWYEKAALQGDASAQLHLGVLYENGNGVPKDYQLALFWFRRSANNGNAMTLTKLGRMYEHGNGVPKDLVQAEKWYILGAAGGDKFAAELRDALAKQMAPGQIFQAKEQAREWAAKSK